MPGLQAKPVGRQWRPVEVRKITPSATAEPLQAAPARIQALLQPSVSAQQQVLQAAFLDQYSSAEDKARPPSCWLWVREPGLQRWPGAQCSSVLPGRLDLCTAGWPGDLGPQAQAHCLLLAHCLLQLLAVLGHWPLFMTTSRERLLACLRRQATADAQPVYVA